MIDEMGHVFLGTGLKRLAEPVQAGAARVIADAGLPVQPAHMPLLTAKAARPALRLLEFSDEHAKDFRELNVEWIEEMFTLDEADRAVLEDPRARIIEPGGIILFVEADGLGVIGTGALRKSGDNRFELTKMAVRESARGLKAGEFLLVMLLERAAKMGAHEIYLLSNWKCAAAVHLYEKLGFKHDEDIMAGHSRRYERCDVAMRYVIREKARHDA